MRAILITDANLLIDTVSAVMRLEEMRARSAAKNIAIANVPGAGIERFDAMLQFDRLRTAVSDSKSLATEVALMSRHAESEYLHTSPTSLDTPMALDAQVLEMSAASGRYQALSEGVSRQFALMRLAISGGRS